MKTFKKILAGLLAFLFIGGAICCISVAFTTMKSLIPIIATFVVVGFGVPTLVKLIKKVIE